MTLAGSVDMQFCFSVLFFVQLTALICRAVFSRPGKHGGRSRSAQPHQADEAADDNDTLIHRLKQSEKER